MAEVAIKAVEAVFDWRAYLKTEFNLDIPYENKENGDLSAASAQSESGESEERTGNVPETELHNDFSETLLKEGTKVLEQHKIQEARLDAWLLLEYVTGMNRAFISLIQLMGLKRKKRTDTGN